MNNQQHLQGLYTITNEELLPAEQLIPAVVKAIAGGSRIIQFRDKTSDPLLRKQLALTLQAICTNKQTLFIVNDDIELALEVQADGVHLGKDDSQLTAARERLGSESIIGISCYNQFELALAAEKSGADYVAFGSFYQSDIKPDAVQADTQLLISAKKHLHIPVVAIGGITQENATRLIDAGADMLAVISAVFAQADIEASARQFSRLFNDKHANNNTNNITAHQR
jgi:thiamine-phosphate pyrophosphorylase